MSEPVKIGGMGLRPRMEMQAVSGRLRFLPRVLKEIWVSPSPWRSIRTLMGEPDGGGMISRVRFWGKSDLVGRRDGGIFVF